MERRRYRRRRVARTAGLFHTSKDQSQTGGKVAVKSTPSWERTPTLFDPLGVGHSIPIMGSLYDRNQFVEGKINPSIKRLEATIDSSAAEAKPRSLQFVIMCC